MKNKYNISFYSSEMNKVDRELINFNNYINHLILFKYKLKERIIKLNDIALQTGIIIITILKWK